MVKAVLTHQSHAKETATHTYGPTWPTTLRKRERRRSGECFEVSSLSPHLEFLAFVSPPPLARGNLPCGLQVFGIDVTLDSQLRPQLFEFNTGADLYDGEEDRPAINRAVKRRLWDELLPLVATARPVRPTPAFEVLESRLADFIWACVADLAPKFSVLSIVCLLISCAAISLGVPVDSLDMNIKGCIVCNVAWRGVG